MSEERVSIEQLLESVAMSKSISLVVSSKDSCFELTVPDLQARDIEHIPERQWIAINKVSCLIPVTDQITIIKTQDFDNATLEIYTIYEKSIKVSFMIRS